MSVQGIVTFATAWFVVSILTTLAYSAVRSWCRLRALRELMVPARSNSGRVRWESPE